jgi:Tfp pilus assembly protein PilZ
MASEDSSGQRPAAPIVLRIKLRYDDVEVMVARFATNVGKSGLFLPTKSLQPIGAEIKFELRLADDTAVLVGLGRVKAATPPDPNNPKATFGMAIELMRVTPQSRALILRMLERRRTLGLPELGLPMSADIDAARRAEAASAAAPEPVSGALPVPAMPAPIEGSAGEAVLTAPRQQPGPMTVAKVLAVTPLAPEPPRRKRLAISEVIESASGPVARVSVVTPGPDDHVDLAAAIVRARSLIGGALEAELDALSERAAAPLDISIEAASAALAKQLGGSAVRRDRSARWASPPMTAIPAPAHHEVEPDQITDEVHKLGALDLEDAEHTESGDIPAAPGVFDPLAGYVARAGLDAGPREDEIAAPPLDLGLDVGFEEVDELEILAEGDADAEG